ncbi:MAG TPA: hydroxyacid dehydrogenase [Dehalococcoidia bacterium]|nr:hydroxyacid dehydrogenase [Dehalococcoidia bacterium]
MSLGRVLVERFADDVLEWLRARCDVVVVDPWVEPDRWLQEAPNVDAVISRKGQITREQMEASNGRMRLIARTGVGVDPSRVDLKAAKELRVWVTNQPGSNSVAVTELAFAQMLSLLRHTHEANIAVRENRWGDYMSFFGTELAGKTLGIVGMGNIGMRVAQRARAFEMEFVVYDPYIPPSHVVGLGGRPVELDQLLRDSDVITVHCPRNEETTGMIGARELGLMRRHAILLNLARGGIVEEQALCEALSNGTIAGAAIDAMSTEPPPPGHPFFKLPNLLLTPHIGAGTAEAASRGEWGAVEEVVRVLEGKRPLNPVIELE